MRERNLAIAREVLDLDFPNHWSGWGEPINWPTKSPAFKSADILYSATLKVKRYN